MCGKFIPTKENHETVSPKMFMWNMVYPKRVYIVLIATLVILKGIWELRRNIIRTIRVQNEKIKKGGASLLNFCNDHL